MTSKEIEAKCLDVKSFIETQRANDPSYRVVLTNGCFDILHRGHVECLHRAKSYGDILLVAVNDDEGIRALKGPDRPIFPLEDRIYMLESLADVGYAIPFHGKRATELFRFIRPDVYVKGGDYTLDSLNPEEREALLSWDPQPEFVFVPFITDISTTKIIAKLKL